MLRSFLFLQFLYRELFWVKYFSNFFLCNLKPNNFCWKLFLDKMIISWNIVVYFDLNHNIVTNFDFSIMIFVIYPKNRKIIYTQLNYTLRDACKFDINKLCNTDQLKTCWFKKIVCDDLSSLIFTVTFLKII